MMSIYNLYDLDGVQTQLKRELAKARAYLDAWECVTYPTKKDGSPYANMSKNFDGASYRAEKFATFSHEYELIVDTYVLSGYISDSISCYQQVAMLKDPEQIAKKQNYLPGNPYTLQMYLYDLDDIKKAVETRKTQLTEEIARLEHELDIAEKVFSDFQKKIISAVAEMSETCNTKDPLKSSLCRYVYDVVCSKALYFPLS